MPLSTGASIAFWVIAAVTVLSSLAVVMLRNIFHAALFLVVSFLSMAGLFVVLNADFVAVAQVLIYAGAISILLIFALLLTRDFQQGSESNRLVIPGIFAGGLLLVTLVVVFMRAAWDRPAASLTAQTPLTGAHGGLSTTAAIADLMFNKFILPFEIAAVLLLAAIIGAIVLGREEA